jgi:hypothetical protein
LDDRAQNVSQSGRIPEKYFRIWKCPPEETEPILPSAGLGRGGPGPGADSPAGVYRLEAPPPQPYFHRN